MSRKKHSIQLQRFVAALTAGVFCVNTLAWPVPEVRAPELNQSPLLIPQELGTVEAFDSPDLPSSFPFVIHIQDAHASPEAQERIREILNHLSRRTTGHSPLLVALEGAAGPLHPEYLRVGVEGVKENGEFPPSRC